MSRKPAFPKPAFRLLPRSRLTVAAILREPQEIVMRFVAWYLAQEADRIVLCFEDPEDPSIAMLDGIAGVECIPCTPEFWHSIGIDPSARFSKRQNWAMSHVYSTVLAGWFLNVDCDELLYLKGRSVAEELDAQPEDTRAVRFLTAEHIHTPASDGLHFRLAMSTMGQLRAYAGSVAGMTLRRGLMGHFLGKSATRAGQPGLVTRQHAMLDLQGEAIPHRVMGAAQGAYLLHFIDGGFSEWCGKLPTRMSNRWFPAPMRDLILAALDLPEPEPELRKLYDIFFVFDADRLERLRQAGARFDLDVDPDAVAVQFFRARVA